MRALRNSGGKYSEAATTGQNAEWRRPQQMGAACACDKRRRRHAVQMLAPARPQPVNSQAIQGRYGEEQS
ncbi:hypothetical protein DB811_18925 [Xanthomonas perforans]|uniref:Uncharacterized protein n=1 Tax=Xanthomonas perforans TaxID=442694 RepID=A0AAQ1BWZ1_XANPE|nr:hypothetical protein BJD11_14285 [Xanthomonas euvesicatoria]APO99108.1 hypothetical protein BJD13_08500 [Xanthomonas perforans]AQS75616.1 hypothetical protein XPE_04220 [Xanthomonas perforans 91-118]AYO95978.1 hypothetical protein Xcom_14070 [Xanthomonas axonopodis pv. commiphoreae]PPU90717.1 hypothetical protein XaclCFBP3371_03455 [Xanthomonas euvesicatoria pv. citrumelonis]